MAIDMELIKELFEGTYETARDKIPALFQDMFGKFERIYIYQFYKLYHRTCNMVKQAEVFLLKQGKLNVMQNFILRFRYVVEDMKSI